MMVTIYYVKFCCKEFTAGDVITMQAGCRHTVSARTELQLIEIQLGEDINVQDKQKFPLD